MSRDLTSTLKVAAVPVVGVLALAFAWTHHPHGLGFIVLLAILMAAVLTAVSHAEVIAHRVGEPLGALVLALCVTVIEASLIISMMFSHHGEGDTVARDTVFAAVMIFTHNFAFGLLSKLDPTARALAGTPAMLMVGAAIGPVLGGVLVQSFGFGSLGVAAIVIAIVAVALFSQARAPSAATAAVKAA